MTGTVTSARIDNENVVLTVKIDGEDGERTELRPAEEARLFGVNTKVVYEMKRERKPRTKKGETSTEAA
jgi:hypothetical protein